MGSLGKSHWARRFAKLETQLEAQMAGLWDAVLLEEDQIAREALSMLPEPELRLVISGLRRGCEWYAGMPPDTRIPPETWEELLTEEELAALKELEALRAELRENAG